MAMRLEAANLELPECALGRRDRSSLSVGLLGQTRLHMRAIEATHMSVLWNAGSFRCRAHTSWLPCEFPPPPFRPHSVDFARTPSSADALRTNMDFMSELRHRLGLETVMCEPSWLKHAVLAEAMVNDRADVCPRTDRPTSRQPNRPMQAPRTRSRTESSLRFLGGA